MVKDGRNCMKKFESDPNFYKRSLIRVPIKDKNRGKKIVKNGGNSGANKCNKFRQFAR